MRHKYVSVDVFSKIPWSSVTNRIPGCLVHQILACNRSLFVALFLFWLAHLSFSSCVETSGSNGDIPTFHWRERRPSFTVCFVWSFAQSIFWGLSVPNWHLSRFLLPLICWEISCWGFSSTSLRLAQWGQCSPSVFPSLFASFLEMFSVQQTSNLEQCALWSCWSSHVFFQHWQFTASKGHGHQEVHTQHKKRKAVLHIYICMFMPSQLWGSLARYMSMFDCSKFMAYVALSSRGKWTVASPW